MTHYYFQSLIKKSHIRGVSSQVYHKKTNKQTKKNRQRILRELLCYDPEAERGHVFGSGNAEVAQQTCTKHGCRFEVSSVDFA